MNRINRTNFIKLLTPEYTVTSIQNTDILVQFSLYVHNGSLKPHSFLFYETQLLLFSLTLDYKLLSCVQLGLILPGKMELVQFSLYVHNGSLKPHSFLFYETQLLLFSLTLDYKLLSCVQLGLILPGKMDLVQFSLYVHNGSLKPHSFLFYETQLLLFSLTIHYKLLSCVQLGLILTGKLDLRSRPFYEL